MRNVVIEHNILTQSEGKKLPSAVIDGGLWGDDFENFALPETEKPSTYILHEGIDALTDQKISYHQTFLRTNKTDEQLLEEYK